ncbi:MAG TPA: ATP-binding protein [Polyangiaceae bacterium]|nr:ATP-binding protein [Polyangiaceae bacterium]
MASPATEGAPAESAAASHESSVSDRRGPRLRHSLQLRVTAAACGWVALALALQLVLDEWLARPLLAGSLALAASLPIGLWLLQRLLAPVLALFRALAGTVSSYRDGDFSFSLLWPRADELGELVAAHNALGDTLRRQRLALVQRELLLDTMLQNTPVALLLFDPSARVVYANLAARKLLHGGQRMEGLRWDDLFVHAPEPLREAIARGGDGLFAVEREDEDEVYYLARSVFRLNGRAHELFALRRLTAELRRQEVRTWKKVIRVISHELNNSLGPIASLAQSGSDLLDLGEHDPLQRVFDAIAERSRHLEKFIQGYARFAKLPAPQPESVAWLDFLERLRAQLPFAIEGSLPDARARFDAGQIEQALLNLLRNAHESGSAPADVQLRVRRSAGALSIDICDRGPGMSETVLSQALLPFYSTKRGGTGLGLALAREIAEAHGGRVALANREGGGLSVSLILPQ